MSDIQDEAAKRALNDVRHLIKHSSDDGPSEILNPAISNKQLINLLKSNFSKLDPNNDGISRAELLRAISNPAAFSQNEFEMLKLITKYFDTIINLSDDEPGEELRISQMDAQVLEQFLLHSKLTVQELHMWCQLGDDPEEITGPPPISNS